MLDEIFDNFSKNSIFKNKRTLQANYTPEVIRHRESEIKQIASILAPSLRLEKPSNLFLYGVTGTGKTLTVKYVMEQMIEVSNKKDISFGMYYINCKLKRVADTEYRLIAQISREFGLEVPATGLPTEEV